MEVVEVAETAVETNQLGLIQKLSKIRQIAGVVQKDKKGYNYSYSDINGILANVTAGMKKYKVSLYPTVVPGTFHAETTKLEKTKFTKTGESYIDVNTEVQVQAQMEFLWVDDENPNDTIKIPWYLIGSQGDPSQAFGSALTYCTRYFLVEFFQIAQPEKDVDEYRSKQKAAEESEDRAVAEGIIAEFDTTVKQYLADNQDKAEDVKQFISKYAKKSNYFAIKDPKLAAKLLGDFKEFFMTTKAEDDTPQDEPAEKQSGVKKAKAKK